MVVGYIPVVVTGLLQTEKVRNESWDHRRLGVFGRPIQYVSPGEVEE